MKLTIEKKTIEEIEINTPCYRKLDRSFSLIYFKYDNNKVIEITGDAIGITTYNEYSNERLARHYNNSVEISKGEFYAVFDDLVNKYKSLI